MPTYKDPKAVRFSNVTSTSTDAKQQPSRLLRTITSEKLKLQATKVQKPKR